MDEAHLTEPHVVHDDESFLVVWKPSWAILHGAQGDECQSAKQSVEQWGTARLGSQPRVVLDPEMPRQKEQRGCSGLVLICKDKSLVEIPLVVRSYTALVAGPVQLWGSPDREKDLATERAEGTVQAAGKSAHDSENCDRLLIEVLDRTPSYECGELCLVRVRAADKVHAPLAEQEKRGVRRAMQKRGHPVVGKPSMGKCKMLNDCRGNYIACTTIEFLRPAGEWVSVTHPAPSKFMALLNRHRKSFARIGDCDATSRQQGPFVQFCDLLLEVTPEVFAPRAGTAETVALLARRIVTELSLEEPSSRTQENRREVLEAEMGGGWGPHMEREDEGSTPGRAAHAEEEQEEDAVRVLDLGTGSGNLLLAALHAGQPASEETETEEGADGSSVRKDTVDRERRRSVHGVGVDSSESAVVVARRNAERAAVHASFLCADFGQLHSPTVRPLLGPGYCPFDLILLAPPEAGATWRGPKWERRGEEPASTTIAGATGLEGYQAVRASLAAAEPPLLREGGRLLVRANSRSFGAVRWLFLSPISKDGGRAREGGAAGAGGESEWVEEEVVKDARGVKCGLLLRLSKSQPTRAADDGQARQACGVGCEDEGGGGREFDEVLQRVLRRAAGGGRGGPEREAATEGEGGEQSSGPMSNGKLCACIETELGRSMTIDEKRAARRARAQPASTHNHDINTSHRTD